MNPCIVEVDPGTKLINDDPDWRERMVPGLVVPIPRLPVPMNLAASVRAPERRVENTNAPVPVSKFWVRIEVMAAVVVAAVFRVPCGVVEPARVLKTNLVAVLVAEAKLVKARGVEVAADEVSTSVSRVSGVVVPRPNCLVVLFQKKSLSPERLVDEVQNVACPADP